MNVKKGNKYYCMMFWQQGALNVSGPYSRIHLLHWPMAVGVVTDRYNDRTDMSAVFYYMSSFSCICPVIDHEFHHNIVQVAVDLWGDSSVDPQTTLTMLWQNSLPITGQTHEKFLSNLFFKITNCQIIHSLRFVAS